VSIKKCLLNKDVVKCQICRRAGGLDWFCYEKGGGKTRLFTYWARTETGERIKGDIWAYNTVAVMQLIEGHGFVPIAVFPCTLCNHKKEGNNCRLFTYRARTETGERIYGEIWAHNAVEVMQLIEGHGFVPISVFPSVWGKNWALNAFFCALIVFILGAFEYCGGRFIPSKGLVGCGVIFMFISTVGFVGYAVLAIINRMVCRLKTHTDRKNKFLG